MSEIVDLALDNITWDLYLENRDLAVVSGIDAIKQNIRQRIQMFMGESKFNIEAGVPYFEDIFKKNPDPAIVRSAFVKVITETSGILELTKLELDLNTATRVLSLTFRAVCDDGVILYGPSIIGVL